MDNSAFFSFTDHQVLSFKIISFVALVGGANIQKAVLSLLRTIIIQCVFCFQFTDFLFDKLCECTPLYHIQFVLIISPIFNILTLLKLGAGYPDKSILTYAGVLWFCWWSWYRCPLQEFVTVNVFGAVRVKPSSVFVLFINIHCVGAAQT